MIDLHCHILPGIDDGSKDIEETLEMARIAVSEGIHHMWLLCQITVKWALTLSLLSREWNL